ncbi:MAG: T9SS type A sorting domain-containing protein [Bacteroidales bacterium]
MKRKLLLVVFSAFTAISAVCQTYVPFPTSGAKWNNLVIHRNESYRRDTTLERLLIKNDTVLNNHTYHILWSQTGKLETPVNFYVGGIREENKKIYFSEFYMFPNEEILLYDFSKQVGDTVFHHPAFKDYSTHTRILDIDSVIISGKYRKRFKVFGMTGEDYWVEGIGSIQNGLYTHIIPIPTCICQTTIKFICFNANDSLIYKNPEFDDCIPSFLRSSINVPSVANTKVYQQVGSLVVESSEIPDKIEVCDLLGKNVYSMLPIEPKSVVSLLSCRKGVYIVKSTFGKSIVTSKIVIR